MSTRPKRGAQNRAQGLNIQILVPEPTVEDSTAEDSAAVFNLRLYGGRVFSKYSSTADV